MKMEDVDRLTDALDYVKGQLEIGQPTTATVGLENVTITVEGHILEKYPWDCDPGSYRPYDARVVSINEEVVVG